MECQQQVEKHGGEVGTLKVGMPVQMTWSGDVAVVGMRAGRGPREEGTEPGDEGAERRIYGSGR